MINDEQKVRHLVERGYATRQQAERFIRSRAAARAALAKRQTVQ